MNCSAFGLPHVMLYRVTPCSRGRDTECGHTVEHRAWMAHSSYSPIQISHTAQMPCDTLAFSSSFFLYVFIVIHWVGWFWPAHEWHGAVVVLSVCSYICNRAELKDLLDERRRSFFCFFFSYKCPAMIRDGHGEGEEEVSALSLRQKKNRWSCVYGRERSGGLLAFTAIYRCIEWVYI